MVFPSMASLEMALFLLQKYIREKEKFFFQDARRGLAMFL